MCMHRARKCCHDVVNISKHMQGRLQTLPLCESSRDDVIDSITRFLTPRNYSKVSLNIGLLSSSCWLTNFA